MSVQVASETSMAGADYFGVPGLSYSGLKDLAVSPTRYWHKHVRPDREKDEPTPEMLVGSAVHCAVLEPSEFDKRYACELDIHDHPGVLTTVESIKGWLTAHDVKPKGIRKADLIEQVIAVDPTWPVLDLLEQAHAKEHADKVIFKQADWQRIQGAASALLDEPQVREILAQGEPEAAYFVTDPETGVLLKSKMDWVAPTVTLDLKTFSQSRGKSIDQTVNHAIWYEGYYIQAYFYSMVRALAEGKSKRNAPQKAPEFVLAFVESDEPFEVRMRSLRPTVGGEVNLYWERARIQVRELIRTYAEYVAHFGEKPWRYAQEVSELCDAELPAAVAY